MLHVIRDKNFQEHRILRDFHNVNSTTLGNKIFYANPIILFFIHYYFDCNNSYIYLASLNPLDLLGYQFPEKYTLKIILRFIKLAREVY